MVPPEDEPEGLRERLFRERRLLLGVSVILLAHQSLGITVGKSAETLGLHFEVDNPERLFLAVWLIWVWTIICYLQQLGSLKRWVKYPIDRHTAIQYALCDWIVMRRVRKAARSQFKQTVSRERRVSLSLRSAGRSVTDGGKTSPVHTSIAVNWVFREFAGEPPTLKKSPWPITTGTDAVKGDDRQCREIVSVPIAELLNSRWTAWPAGIWTLLSTSFATDYFAPILVGLAPALVAVVQSILSMHSPF